MAATAGVGNANKAKAAEEQTAIHVSVAPCGGIARWFGGMVADRASDK